LLHSGQYRSVTWPSRSTKPNSFQIADFEGEKIFIEETGDPFDLWAIDTEGNQVFFEVKSRADNESKTSFGLSRNQVQFFKERARNPGDRVEVVNVTNAISPSPTALYFRLETISTGA
jgi:hypothetical protein